MPELPDVEVYVEALRERIVSHRLNQVGIYSPFLLRSATPPVESVYGRSVSEVRRLGKRIAIGLEGDLWIAIHLMIAGRLHWRDSPPKLGTKVLLAVFLFVSGVLAPPGGASQHRT